MSDVTQYDHLETERRGSVLIVRLANESARNSLSTEMRFSLPTVCLTSAPLGQIEASA